MDAVFGYKNSFGAKPKSNYLKNLKMKSKNAISTNQAVKPRSRRTKSFVSNTLSKKLFFKENIQPLSAKKDKQNDTIQNIEDTADKRSKIEAIGTIDLLGKTASE
jgi:hypothetical protein